MAKAIKEQKVWPEQGYWKARGVEAKETLDYVGKKCFVELFEHYPSSRECEDGPHNAHACSS